MWPVAVTGYTTHVASFPGHTHFSNIEKWVWPGNEATTHARRNLFYSSGITGSFYIANVYHHKINNHQRELEQLRLHHSSGSAMIQSSNLPRSMCQFVEELGTSYHNLLRLTLMLSPH